MAEVLASEIVVAIGTRVRRWRTERNWTLDGLAERSGVSRRSLVDIEQAQANPSISVLLRLANAFGVSLAALIEENTVSPVTVHRAGDSPRLWEGLFGGYAILVGSTEPPNVVEHWEWIMEPSESHESEAHSIGTREIVLVHEGSLLVTVGGNETILNEGDSIVMTTDQSHGYCCKGNKQTRFTMTVMQPGVGN
jgi:transcriptional regulator with XRE-family HTH domain